MLETIDKSVALEQKKQNDLLGGFFKRKNFELYDDKPLPPSTITQKIGHFFRRHLTNFFGSSLFTICRCRRKSN